MAPLRLAVAARCLPSPFRRAIRAAVAVGAKGIQFDVRNELKPSELSETGRRQLLHDLELEGLSISSLQFPTRRSFYDQSNLEKRVAACKQALEFAHQLRVPVVTARAGAIPREKDSAKYRLLVDVLNDMARHSNRVGATLAITPTCDSAADLAGLLSFIKDGPIGINFDPATFAMTGRNAVEAFRELHPLVVHVTARDGLRDIDGTGLEVALGRGEVDWPELIELLTEAEYRGWVTVDRTNSADAAADAERALQYLTNVASS